MFSRITVAPFGRAFAQQCQTKSGPLVMYQVPKGYGLTTNTRLNNKLLDKNGLHTAVKSSELVRNNLPLSSISDYHMEKKIGSGGESRVFLGHVVSNFNRDNSPHLQKCAFKIIVTYQNLPSFTKMLGGYFSIFDNLAKKEEHGLRELTKAKAQEEYELVSQFSDHPNILQYVISEPLETEEGEVALALELCQGSIDSLFKGDMDAPKLLGFLADASDALAHMHKMGYCHSDLKPPNIFISQDGTRGLLGDFGATTKTGETNKLTTEGFCPNSKESGVSPNRESDDIYALGVTISDLISHPKLFDESNTKQLFLKLDLLEFAQSLQDESNELGAVEVSERLRELASKAEKIGCQPIGDED